MVSYGQVALMAGVPKAAQAVGQTLRHLEVDMVNSMYGVPWWRVVNNAGRVSIKGNKYHNALTQKALLEKENVVIRKDLIFDIEKYRWRPSVEVLEKLELNEEYIEQILSKYFY